MFWKQMAASQMSWELAVAHMTICNLGSPHVVDIFSDKELGIGILRKRILGSFNARNLNLDLVRVCSNLLSSLSSLYYSRTYISLCFFDRQLCFSFRYSYKRSWKDHPLPRLHPRLSRSSRLPWNPPPRSSRWCSLRPFLVSAISSLINTSWSSLYYSCWAHYSSPAIYIDEPDSPCLSRDLNDIHIHFRLSSCSALLAEQLSRTWVDLTHQSVSVVSSYCDQLFESERKSTKSIVCCLQILLTRSKKKLNRQSIQQNVWDANALRLIALHDVRPEHWKEWHGMFVRMLFLDLLDLFRNVVESWCG